MSIPLHRPLRPSFRPVVESLEQRTLLTAGVLAPTFSHAAVVRPFLNGGPTAADDAYRVTTGTPLVVPVPLGVLANDTGRKLIAVEVSPPAHGALLLHASGSFVYTPRAGFTGTDSFTYKARDGGLDSNVATVTLQVAAPARVQGVSVDRNDSGQVTSLTVTFTEVVTFDLTTLVKSPFGLIRGSGRGLSLPLRVSSSVVGGKTVAVLTVNYNGSTTPLPSSPYALTIKGANVSYGIGQLLDGDGNGTQQGNFVLTFSV